MRLGINVGSTGHEPDRILPLVHAAETAGFDSVWASEVYGSDAVSVLGYLAGRTSTIGLGSGVLQMPARTPANTAMTAMTLNSMSRGRLRLGLGVSGPQVVEGWHGVPYGKPLGRTREYVDILRTVFERRTPLTHHGDHYRIPYRDADATGLGKPLRSTLKSLTNDIPIYLAAIGPKNVELAGEIADGWLAIFYSPENETASIERLDAGLAGASRSPADVEIVTTVEVAVGDDLEAARDRVRPTLALYIGGMGSRSKNFYNDLVRRYGYVESATAIQELYLDGKQREAAAAVPDSLVDELALVGPYGRIIERLEAWKDSRVDVLLLRTEDIGLVRALGDA